MRKLNFQRSMTVLVLIIILTSCTSFKTRDGLYKVAKDGAPEATIDARPIEDELDILDEEIALGGIDVPLIGFDFGPFTDMGTYFVDRLSGDVDLKLKEDKDYLIYDLLASVPKDDLMSVVHIDLAYLMQFDEGTWTDRRTDYPSGDGYSLSTFSQDEGVYSFDLSYKDTSGDTREIKVVYDSRLERYNYVSESYDAAGVLSYQVWQQFCKSDEGFYYQAIRHSVVDDRERACFSYFDNNAYETYITPTEENIKLSGFIYDLYESVPENLTMMVTGYEAVSHVSNNTEVGFIYDQLRNSDN